MKSGIAILTFFLLVVTSACCSYSPRANASSGVPSSTTSIKSGSRSFSKMFSEQNLCDRVWRDIYKQWVQNGGGIKKTMTATRREIFSDKKSVLARIVRGVWSSSMTPRGNVNRLWGWPLDKGKSRKLSSIFSKVSKKYLPTQCATLAWLPSIVWDNLRFVDGDPLKFHMPSEAPSNVKWNGHTAPRWVLYWLLVKIPSSER